MLQCLIIYVIILFILYFHIPQMKEQSGAGCTTALPKIVCLR